MPIEKRCIDEQLKKLPGFKRYAGRGEIAYLPDMLIEGETIQALATGNLYGRGYAAGQQYLVVATDRRLLFLSAGLLSGLRRGELSLRQITAVTHRTGRVQGSVDLTTSEGRVIIDKIANNDVQRLARVLAELISRQATDPAPAAFPPPGIPGQPDIITQLERLVQLKERGALTEQEFQTLKARLLAQ